MKLIQTMKKHQFLFEELVKRDFKKKYKGTFLGVAWSLLSPLLTLLVMRLIFTNFFGRNTPHYTTYLFCGNLIFTFFSDSTTNGMTALRSNASIYSKVNIPKYMFLLAKNVQTTISFLITMVVLFIFAAFDNITFTWQFLQLLYSVGCLLLLNLGTGLILSALYVFFRDMQYLYDVFLKLLMYFSAIFYTVDTFSPRFQKVFLINPVYVNIKFFRMIIIDGVCPSPQYYALMFCVPAVIFAIGCWMYKKFNTRFLYYV